MIERAWGVEVSFEPISKKEWGDIFRVARKNSEKRKIAWRLQERDIYDLVATSGGRCAVTGLPFSATRREGHQSGERRPFVPSLDRIDSRGAYDRSNVRLVCAIVNQALGEWGEDPFWLMVMAAAQTRRYGGLKRWVLIGDADLQRTANTAACS